MVEAINQEIIKRKSFISEEVETIYFGGGTPSLLTPSQLDHLLKTIQTNFQVSSGAEVTLEANPEDLTLEKAESFLSSGINRLSIGIQTFDSKKLTWMNRAHSSNESVSAYENARSAGFQNVSLDLIYALPDHDEDSWKHDLKSMVDLNPEHISIYGLTIEDKTVFGKWERDEKLIQIPEEQAAKQYLFAVQFLKSYGFIQYEVSNFGKEGFHSRHNHSYWSGKTYLGVGPGAHSFDGRSVRRFNVRSNPKYLKALSNGDSYYEEESLSKMQRVNERILTELRTKAGIDLSKIKELTSQNLREIHKSFIDQMIHDGFIEISSDRLWLTPQGFLIADEIALRLFFPE